MADPRREIEQVVLERATRDTLDKVASLRSDANAERTIQREYHGRFLIELLQNARDAWAETAASRDRGGTLRIELSAGELDVANEGVPLDAGLLLYSLGKFGEGTKVEGQAIGHKGIGFKSVLEVSLTPEVYSRSATSGPFDLAVRFDPEHAYELVQAHSPNLQDLAAQLPAEAPDDPLEAIPVLGFPIWVDQPTQGWDGFNTVVRLRHDQRYNDRLGLTAAGWQERVQAAVDELSDEIVLLLGVFESLEVRIDGEPHRTIERRILDSRDTEAGQVSNVEIRRDGSLSTRWRLFERSLAGATGLEGDHAVAVRLESADGPLVPCLPAQSSGTGPHCDCFHLFFPTVIPTKLPFLLHAYFEVNASRTGFAADSEDKNRILLDGLRDLIADALEDLAGDPSVDIRSLPDLFAATHGDPSDDLTREFRDRLLDHLDDVHWVAALGADGTPSVAKPAALLADHREAVGTLLPVAFPSRYLATRVGRFHPDPSVSQRGLGFLAGRPATSLLDSSDGKSSLLSELLRPTEHILWPTGSVSQGFRALCQLLSFLLATDPEAAGEVVDATRGDSQAAFIPVVTSDGPHDRMISPPLPREPTSDGDQESSTGVFARVTQRKGGRLIPPDALNAAFVPDGVLDTQLLASVGARLGIREYTTNAVLDRLAAAPTDEVDEAAMLQFVWRLLLRERDSRYGVRQALYEAADVDPAQWFWCEPGRARSSEGRTEQRRAQALCGVRVLSADGSWQPACQLAFGQEWANGLDGLGKTGGDATAQRSAWYRSLARAAPEPHNLVAGPDALVGLLSLDSEDIEWLAEEEAPGLLGRQVDVDDLEAHDTLIGLVHAFLLRLGVWEIPPLEAVVDYRARPEADRDPWGDLPGRGAHLEAVAANDGYRFGVVHSHQASGIHIGEDYRLLWPLTAGDEVARLAGLGAGAHVYSRYLRLRMFCPGCATGGHTRWYHNDEAHQPSFLEWQIQETPCVPVTVDGEPSDPRIPREAWWHPSPPKGTAITQSPYRYLPLAVANSPEAFLRLAAVPTLDTAPPDRLRGLLDDLRVALDGDQSPNPRTGTAERQAFIGLHRLIYSRLAAEPATEAPQLNEVLAEDGPDLVYPVPAQCRHDDGRHAGYRRHFVGRVPFVALARDQEAVAAAFGIPRFALEVTRQQAGQERDVSDELRALIQDRIPEIMAILVFHALGGASLELGSEAFRERARRLSCLRAIQVDDLALHLRVVGTDITETIGVGPDRDLYLDGPTTTRPVLYHDFNGDGWVDRLRRHLSPHLAELVQNPAYGATLALLLQYDEPSERESWLLELGITDLELDQVRGSLQVAGLVTREEERRWWTALLPLLGCPVALPDDDADLVGVVRAALQDGGHLGSIDDIGFVLLNSGGGLPVRRDTRPGSPLAALEAHDIDLKSFDEALRGLHDPGLQIDRAERLLQIWTARHGREVAAALYRQGEGLSAEEARARPASWRVPEHIRWRVNVAASEALEPVAKDLEAAGLGPVEQGRLAGDDTAAYLASLAGLSVEALHDSWRALYSEDDQRRFQRDAAIAWRAALIPVLVAIKVAPHEPGYRIRAEVDPISDALPSAPQAPTDLVPALRQLATPHEQLADDLAVLLAAHDGQGLPDRGDLDALFAPYISGGTAQLDRVRETLRRESAGRIDTIRSRATELRNRGLQPTFKGARGIHKQHSPHVRSRSIKPIHVKKNPRRLTQLGAEGESWALAAVMAPLLALSLDDRRQAITQLTASLTHAYKGDCIEGLVGKAERATSPSADDDEQTEALADFLHLSRTSDMFGCDMLGWLSPYPGAKSQPLFLEVKSTANRQVLISATEWREAKRLRDSYAILLVMRGTDGEAPAAMELLPDPAAIKKAKGLTLSADTWILSYELPDDITTTGGPTGPGLE